VIHGKEYIIGPEDYMKRGRNKLSLNNELAIGANTLKDRQ